MKVGASETLQYLSTAGLLFVLAVGDFEHTCTPEDTTPHIRGACGTTLDNVVRLICSINPYKRSGNFQISGDKSKEIDTFIPTSEALTPKLPTKKRFTKENSYAQAKAFQFLRWRRTPYYANNIVCECCLNHCTPGELMQYC